MRGVIGVDLLKMDKVSLDELMRECRRFDKLEKRGTFYNMALNLVNRDLEIEAFFLILATWNFATFRYAMKEFDINRFKYIVKNECNPIFDRIKDKRLETVNFDDIGNEVKELYDILSSIKGVKYTGASKLMHLKNPYLFVMWDGYIKSCYGFRNGTAEEYVSFLKKMQEMFKDVGWKYDSKTLAKAIDEYNYVTITLPDLEKRRNKKKNSV